LLTLKGMLAELVHQNLLGVAPRIRAQIPKAARKAIFDPAHMILPSTANLQTRPVELGVVSPHVVMSLGNQHSGGKLGSQMVY
jgi:hypothetical protein